MTAPDQNSQTSVVTQEKNDKEYNFRQLQQSYERKLAEANSARLEAERIAQEALASRNREQEHEEESSDPYVDHKRLDKKLNKFNQSTQTEIEKAMQKAKMAAKEELKQEMWMDNNPDFEEVMDKYAEQFAIKSPKLAKSILAMPQSFERQKLVYENIKELGLHRPEQKKPSIQDKIDQNKQNPFQPSGPGAAPYAAQGDFSQSGQKAAYEKIKQLTGKYTSY